jgi:hypothetical protein
MPAAAELRLVDAVKGDLKTRMERPIGIGEGERDDALFRWACSLIARGRTRDEVLADCRECNATFDPSLNEAQVHKIVESASKYENNTDNQASAQPPQPQSADASTPNAPATDVVANLRWHDEETDVVAPAWLIKGMLPETGVGLYAGQWGTGKTFGVLDLAACVARGTPFANYKCKRPGGVLYLAAEGSAQVPIRLQALRKKYLLHRGPVPFACLDYCPPLTPKENEFGLLEFAKMVAQRMLEKYGMPLVLIIIDTLPAAANFKDENDAAEGQQAMNTLHSVSKATGAFVLAVDHFGKAAETGTRGTSAKEAAADAVIACLGERSPTGAVSKTRIAIRKARGAAQGAETPFVLATVNLGTDEDGETITTCTVTWSPVTVPAEIPQAKGDRWSRTAQRIRLPLATAIKQHGREQRPFPGQPIEVRAVELEKVRAEFERHEPAGDDKERDARRKAFKRGYDAARASGLVPVHSGFDSLSLT